MVLEIILIFIIYTSILIISVYYINLFLMKDQYSKEDLKNIAPFLKTFYTAITNNYTFPVLLSIYLFSALFSILLSRIFEHWFMNSAIFPVALFFILPILKNYFEKSQVSSSDNYSDTAVNIFVRYNDILLIGFNCGLATAMIYNWASIRAFHFIWFLPNLLVVTGLTIISIRKTLQ